MHEQFLFAALSQAWLGRGICAPNPSVGAVAVRDGQIIAQAWHHGAGTPHAEQLLLEQLPKNISDLTLYVTLEPCNHWGRTPPCVDSIINHGGVKQVVYAYADPNPVIVANHTPTLLREQGIDVVHYPLPEIDAFYQSYHHWTRTGKPWVTVKLAQSLDGKIAKAAGESTQISNVNCSEFTHQHRLHSDVILTTAKTIEVDNPQLNVRLPHVTVAKPIAILDRKGVVNPNARLFTGHPPCHIYSDESIKNHPLKGQYLIHPIVTNENLLDLEAVINHLGQLGYHDVWVEAGGTLFSALHAARLVNRTYLYIAPKVFGEAGVSAYHAEDLFNIPHQVTWQIMGDNIIATIDWLEPSCSPV